MSKESDNGWRRLAFASARARASKTLPPVGGLAIIIGMALALRWIAAQESLYGDELFSYADSTPSSLAHVFDRMELFREQTPPLYFVLAWLSGKLGDPTTLIRLPSVIAGTAAVPVLYFLGDAIGGRRTGVTAAALIAVMPFAVFYGSEARAYGLLLFLIPLSTLALLRALEVKQGFSWWFLYWAACVLALYSHYVAGIAIALQAGWALLTQRSRWHAVLAANAAVALAFLPWLPMLDNGIETLPVIEALHPLTLKNIVTDPLRVAFGHPFAAFDQVPGLVSIVSACTAGAIVIVGLLSPTPRRSASATSSWRAGGSVDVPQVGLLLVFLTGGVFALTLAYSELDTSIYEARVLITALPYFCLLGGIAAAALQGRLALVAAGALVLGALLGSLRMLVNYPRPDLHAAATAIADRAAPGTPVVEPWRVGHNPINGQDPLQQGLAIYLDDEFQLSHQFDYSSDWPQGREVYTVAVGGPMAGLVAAAAERADLRLVETLSFEGLQEVTVRQYLRVTGGSGRVNHKCLASDRVQEKIDQIAAGTERSQAEFESKQEEIREVRERECK